MTLAACAAGTPVVEEDKPQDDSGKPAIEEGPIRETKNVVYEGIVKPAGISIYQQGSHRLSLADGKFILLESSSVDLNGYVDEHILAYGALRPTVEAGGMIMRVEKVELIGATDDPESGPEEEGEPPEDSAEPEEEPKEKESEDAEKTDEPEDEETEEETKKPPSKEMLENIELLSKQDFSASNWTQEYCTAHIGFCIPVHRNMWFKSFGNTTTYLWHVELSGAPVESIGDGPIQINLFTGASPEADKSVVKAAGEALGYREWTENRHFIIRAPVDAVGAVEYITSNLSSYSPEG